MNRTRWISASVMVLSLTMAACGDSGPKTLSEDDFVDSMEDICADANDGFNDLDLEDSDVFDQGIEITQDALDDFDQLEPPEDLEDDFADFKDNLDDHITQFENFRDAVKDDDSDAAEEASAKLADLDQESDELADDLGADGCVDVGVSGEDPAGTIPDETIPDDTTPITPLPIDTTPIETSPETTTPEATDVPSGEGALDASVSFEPAEGFTWGDFDLSDVATPADDPVLGPVFAAYYAGALDSTTGGDSVAIYILQLTQDSEWTQEQLNTYYASEFLTDGTDTTTPGGLPARIQLDPTNDVDSGAFTVPGFGVAVFGPSGIDVPGILDAFVSAQPTD